MKILITGGTGFIGSRLAFRCIKEGHSVKVLGQENSPAETRNRKLMEEKGAEVVLGSVTDREILFDLTRDTTIVYHLAATQHEMNVPDVRFWNVNVEGTRHILEASLNSQVERFVHGSTIGVYGTLEGKIDEHSPCAPDNIYGVTKLEAEKLVLSFRNRLPVVAVRISEIYGPGDYRLLKLFKAINNNIFFMIGDGRNLHHPLYIDDLIEGFSLASTSEEALGKLFILAGKDSITTNDMVTVIAEHLGRKGPRFRVPLVPMLTLATIIEMILRPLGLQPPIHRRRMDFFKKSFTLSHDRATEILGFVPKVSFRDGALKTAQWYKEMGFLHPDKTGNTINST